MTSLCPFGSTIVQRVLALSGCWASLKSVVVLTEFADMEQATELYASQDFRDAIQRAGVIGAPVVTLVEEVDRLSG